MIAVVPAPLLEVIALDAVDARHAQEGGADRLELVADIASWGLTPAVETFTAVRSATTLPIRVMIRQHEGFAAGSLPELQRTARALRDAGADEFVLGFLDDSSEIDLDAVKTVLDIIDPCPWTFHRAIDYAADRPAAWRAIQDLPGLDYVLTSGGPAGFDGLPAETLFAHPTNPRRRRPAPTPRATPASRRHHRLPLRHSRPPRTAPGPPRSTPPSSATGAPSSTRHNPPPALPPA